MYILAKAKSNICDFVSIVFFLSILSWLSLSDSSVYILVKTNDCGFVSVIIFLKNFIVTVVVTVVGRRFSKIELQINHRT